MQNFIEEHRLAARPADFMREVQLFEAEMTKGLAGRESSLKMIPAFIGGDSPPPRVGGSIAIDMGGTHLRVALVRFRENGEPEIAHSSSRDMPGRREALGRDAFFDILADILLPLLPSTQRIGLCYSFPCEIKPDLDGVMLGFNKEVQVADARGESLRENITAALARKGFVAPLRLVVLNDTVASMLGTRAQLAGRAFGGYAGFILGTGLNACYAEQNALIAKNPELSHLPGSSLVNLEAGGYARFARGAVDERFDAATADPGAQQLEKMLSGAYQARLLLAYLHEAAEQGCFSARGGSALCRLDMLEGREIGAFSDNAFGSNPLAEALTDRCDKAAAYALIDAFYERAAFFLAVMLTAVMKKAGTARDPLAPLCMATEGSTFLHSKLLNRKTRYTLYSRAHLGMGLHYELVPAENTPVLGAAYAASTEL